MISIPYSITIDVVLLCARCKSDYSIVSIVATDVVTVFIFHEPSLLSGLQDSGLTWVVLKSLIIKDVSLIIDRLMRIQKC